MSPAQCILSALQQGHKTRPELIRVVTQSFPETTEKGVDWLLHTLVEAGRCYRPSRGIYALGQGRGCWVPVLSSAAYAALTALFAADTDVPFALWEMQLLAEFGGEIGQNLIFVETRGDLEAAFHLLRKITPHSVLLNPGQKELALYGEATTFIVKKLVSGAPMLNTNPPRIRLEKLLCDLWGERLLRDHFTEEQRQAIFLCAAASYKIDLATLRRYGRRRGISSFPALPDVDSCFPGALPPNPGSFL